MPCVAGAKSVPDSVEARRPDSEVLQADDRSPAPALDDAVSDQSWNCARLDLLNLGKEAMPHRRKAPTERIEVTDQVGKRHVVMRYTETVEADPDEDANVPREVATEY